jgi:hypothetical protein
MESGFTTKHNFGFNEFVFFKTWNNFAAKCVTTCWFCMGYQAYMLQRVAFVTFKISNECAEFCALSMWHVFHRAFIFIFVGLEKSSLEPQSPYLQWLAAYRGFPFKNASSHNEKLLPHVHGYFRLWIPQKRRTKSPLYCNHKFQSVILKHTLAAENASYSCGVITTDGKTCSHKWGALKTCSYYVLNGNGFALPWFSFQETLQ